MTFSTAPYLTAISIAKPALWAVLIGVTLGSYSMIANGAPQPTLQTPAFTPALILTNAKGYRALPMHFFTDKGLETVYQRIAKLDDAALLSELETRTPYVQAELSGPTPRPKGHTDMYNIARWEAAYRGLAETPPTATSF